MRAHWNLLDNISGNALRKQPLTTMPIMTLDPGLVFACYLPSMAIRRRNSFSSRITTTCSTVLRATVGIKAKGPDLPRFGRTAGGYRRSRK